MVAAAAERLNLQQAARELGVSLKTARKWARRGISGAVLDTYWIGGRVYTSRQAIAEFVAAGTAAHQQKNGRVIVRRSGGEAKRQAIREKHRI